MSELSRKKETFLDTLNLRNNVELMLRKAIIEIVKEIADYDGYIGFNDETAFPLFNDPVDDCIESVVACRVRKNRYGEDALQFCTDAVHTDNEDAWFCPYDYGDFDIEFFYSCVAEYVEINEID